MCWTLLRWVLSTVMYRKHIHCTTLCKATGKSSYLKANNLKLIFSTKSVFWPTFNSCHTCDVMYTRCCHERLYWNDSIDKKNYEHRTFLNVFWRDILSPRWPHCPVSTRCLLRCSKVCNPFWSATKFLNYEDTILAFINF